MSIPAKIRLSSLSEAGTINGKISFSPERTALSFAHEGDSFLITLSQGRMRVKKSGVLSYDMLFKENVMSPVSLKTDEGVLQDFYMTTHSLETSRKKDFLSARAVYSFDLSSDTREITLECEFYEN